MGSCPCILIAPNLVPGDAIYAGSIPKINSTIPMNVLGETRDVNFFNGSIVPSVRTLLYSDKATGLLVKAINHIVFAAVANYTLLSTTAWTPAAPSGLFSNPMNLVALGELVIIVALISVMVLRGRGKKK